MAVLSLAILARVRAGADGPARTAQMFFLGAGFMLLETKGVVHLALLFGSTWVVNSIVFFAILVMILLSNLFVLAVQADGDSGRYYALLFASLLVNVVGADEHLPGACRGRRRSSPRALVIFVPVFFAGVIFATSFRDSRQPDVDFGSNIGGVILGGLSENLSLVARVQQPAAGGDRLLRAVGDLQAARADVVGLIGRPGPARRAPGAGGGRGNEGRRRISFATRSSRIVS